VETGNDQNRSEEARNSSLHRGIDKLISISVTLAVLTVFTGQLPKVLKKVRIAQLQLIKDSQASKWGKPMMLPTR
jgi:hypothetical protein